MMLITPMFSRREGQPVAIASSIFILVSHMENKSFLFTYLFGGFLGLGQGLGNFSPIPLQGESAQGIAHSHSSPSFHGKLSLLHRA